MTGRAFADSREERWINAIFAPAADAIGNTNSYVPSLLGGCAIDGGHHQTVLSGLSSTQQGLTPLADLRCVGPTDLLLGSCRGRIRRRGWLRSVWIRRFALEGMGYQEAEAAGAGSGMQPAGREELQRLLGVMCFVLMPGKE